MGHWNFVIGLHFLFAFCALLPGYGHNQRQWVPDAIPSLPWRIVSLTTHEPFLHVASS